MKRLPYDHRDRTLRILASKGGIMTLAELRRSMEIKRENLECILHEFGAVDGCGRPPAIPQASINPWLSIY